MKKISVDKTGASRSRRWYRRRVLGLQYYNGGDLDAWDATPSADIPDDLRAALLLFIGVEAGRRFMRLLV